MKTTFIIVISIFLLCSCVNSSIKDSSEKLSSLPLPPLPILNASYFGEKINVIPVEDVYALTDEQKRTFFEFINNRKLDRLAAHQKLFKFLEQRLTTFDYYSDTANASESLQKNKGNCLSLAILTKALADLVNVKVLYQLVDSEPVYKKGENIVISSQHIRTVLIEPTNFNPSSFKIFKRRIVIDYFPINNSRVLRNVREDEFFSMYYTNKAVEALVEEDDNLAYWNLKKALELKPDDENAINIMAVIHERNGHTENAEKIYIWGLEYSKQNEDEEHGQYLDLLDNYHSLLIQQNRVEDAKQISKRINKRKYSNPFKWVSLGNEAYNHREYKKAISYYLKAKKLAPYLHEVHAGIARSEFQLGNQDAAQSSLTKALKNSHKRDIRDLYQKKLELLENLLNKRKPVTMESDQ